MLQQPSVSHDPRQIHRLRLVRAARRRVAWPRPPQGAWPAVTRPAATGAAAWVAGQSLLQFAVDPAVAEVAQARHRFRDNVRFPAWADPSLVPPRSHAALAVRRGDRARSSAWADPCPAPPRSHVPAMAARQGVRARSPGAAPCRVLPRSRAAAMAAHQGGRARSPGASWAAPSRVAPRSRVAAMVVRRDGRA